MPATKTEIASRWTFRVAAGVWDLFAFLGVVILLLILSSLQTTAGERPFLEEAVVIALLYPVLLIAALDRITDAEYPWYLAWKVENASDWARGYWYWKFSYRLPRHLGKVLGTGRKDLFVRLQVLRAAKSVAQPFDPTKVPGLHDLFRAFRARDDEISLLSEEDRRSGQMLDQAKHLRRRIKEAETYVGAYLGFLVDVYEGFDPNERALIAAAKPETIWDRLEKYPSRFKLLLFVLAVAVAIALYFLGIRVPVNP